MLWDMMCCSFWNTPNLQSMQMLQRNSTSESIIETNTRLDFVMGPSKDAWVYVVSVGCGCGLYLYTKSPEMDAEKSKEKLWGSWKSWERSHRPVIGEELISLLELIRELYKAGVRSMGGEEGTIFQYA